MPLFFMALCIQWLYVKYLPFSLNELGQVDVARCEEDEGQDEQQVILVFV